MHHAFVIEASAEEGIKLALEWAERELPSFAQGYGGRSGLKSHPDVIVFQYGLFSVDDARRVNEIAMQTPIVGDIKIIIIAANRAYHEAQNALLKLFEEPPQSTYLFLVMPSLGGVLPTLLSRVMVLKHQAPSIKHETKIPEIADKFLNMNKEQRSAFIKKLVRGKDEEERRENRDTAIAIVNGIEATAYASETTKNKVLLEDIQELRGHLYDRSAPVKMILEHLSLVVPNNLV